MQANLSKASKNILLYNKNRPGAVTPRRRMCEAHLLCCCYSIGYQFLLNSHDIVAAVCYALFYQPKIFHGFPAKRSIEGFILADIMVSADSVWCFYVSFINREHVSNQKHSLLRSNQSNMIIDTFADAALFLFFRNFPFIIINL